MCQFDIKLTHLRTYHPLGSVDTTSYKATVNLLTNKIELTPINDYSQEAGVICTVDFPCFDTSKPSADHQDRLQPFEFLAYSQINENLTNMINLKSIQTYDAVQRIDMTKSYEALFSNLWYGALPCMTVQGISGDGYNRDPEVLKYCQWKGIKIECAAIFKPFPTDSGMCCVFNLNAAEDIYQSSIYTSLIDKLQKYDRNHSMMSNPTIPDWYQKANEPKTIPGRNKGLYLMLDAHTDLLSITSMENDYTSFKGLISQKGGFPFMAQEGFEIRPGHNNIISLTATRVDADENMHQIDKNSRNCIFYDESSFLKLFKNYTYANCLFECSLLKAKEKYHCIPWYFPISNEPIIICNPWEAHDFLDYMNSITGGNCQNCLPECSSTIYETSIVTVPFRKCDLLNLDMSFLCKLSQRYTQPFPKIYSSLFQSDQRADPISGPYNEQSNRSYNLMNSNGSLFKINDPTYDAFNIDIATVEIYFKKSSAFQIGRQSKMNWIDYFSTVGGLLGLVLGMGFVSFIELFWLGLRLLARFFHFNQWIS